MKKLLVLAALAALTVPVFADDMHDGTEGPEHFNGPRHEMAQNPELQAQMEAKKAEMQAHQVKIKATEEKLEKLVKEYKKAKEGSKKQIAAREEIGKVLAEVRVGQIALREQQIANFEKRLADMKARLAAENTAEAKEAWINKMSERVIAKDGDLKAVLAHYGHMGKGPMKPGHFKGGPKGMKGPGEEGGFFKGGPKGPADDILPMPPAPQEEK